MIQTKTFIITQKGTKKECEEFWQQIQSFYGVDAVEVEDFEKVLKQHDFWLNGVQRWHLMKAIRKGVKK